MVVNDDIKEVLENNGLLIYHEQDLKKIFKSYVNNKNYTYPVLCVLLNGVNLNILEIIDDKKAIPSVEKQFNIKVKYFEDIKHVL